MRNRPVLLVLLLVGLFSLFVSATLPLGAEEPTAAPEDEAVVPQKFEKHYLVLLMRPEHPTTYEGEESQQIQSAHLAHLYELWADGDALIAGPFEVPDDERMRGLVLFRGDLTTDEVKALAEADPAVKANRLEVKVLPWWHGEGLMQFEPPPSE